MDFLLEARDPAIELEAGKRLSTSDVSGVVDAVDRVVIDHFDNHADTSNHSNVAV